MTRCHTTLWDDPTGLQCVRDDTPDHTHVYESAGHPDRHDITEARDE